jgi:21S rRNA (GM2251-2'-O)-methyltransferase
VLALDEVWDPQNFGALLRTAHFLPGVAEVVVCAKNSAPLSETVSKASAGAMETMEVCSVDNMMRFLDNSIAEGWQVVGTSLGDGSTLMAEIPKNRPTILVLGNEGHGIRTNVLRKCSHLVRIEGGESHDSVDSLNVSVTGGIMLHFLST